MLKLESMEKYKGSTLKLVLVSGDEEITAFISTETAAKYSLCTSMELENEKWKEIERSDLLRKARERALYLLDYRDYSYAEMVKKLKQSYDEDICYEVADSLAEKGIINDLRYAEALARQQCEVKLYGSYRARQFLWQKGIPKSVIDRVIEQYEDDAAERAAQLARRRYMHLYDPNDRELTQKLINALVRHGYSYFQANEAVKMLEDE
ncbi:MAG: regulatory protein RecX [Ruminococcus sp.]|nr:regulatory protein RecX [Ruminococcus sp.]